MIDSLSQTEVEEIGRILTRRSLTRFTKTVWKEFQSTPFHESYYSVLNSFAHKKIKNLIVTVPPQHGKSAGSSKYLPSYLLGLNPDLNIALMSYSTTFARKFNRQIQRIIDSDEYREIFPDTFLNSSNVTTVSRGYLRNADEFEVVGHTGSFKSIGREGALTGNPVDLMIYDDLYKDAMEANSPVIRDNIVEMHKTVTETRLHNNSQHLIVFTRWNIDDLIGWLKKNYKVIELDSLDNLLPYDQQNGVYYLLNYEAIKTGEATALDQRNAGEALFPQRHSLERLQMKQINDPFVFSCMYQGNPKDKEGFLYSEFNTYKKLPEVIIKKANYTDTADEGDDFLCSVDYVVDNMKNIYVIDIIFTQESMEVTEQSVPNMMIRSGTKEADVESNAGGRSFARTIQKEIPKIPVRWFHQSKNKESRILTNASQVNKFIYFPEGWNLLFPKFYDHITGYKKKFSANKHDDGADIKKGIIEKNIHSGGFYVK